MKYTTIIVSVSRNPGHSVSVSLNKNVELEIIRNYFTNWTIKKFIMISIENSLVIRHETYM